MKDETLTPAWALNPGCIVENYSGRLFIIGKVTELGNGTVRLEYRSLAGGYTEASTLESTYRFKSIDYNVVFVP